MTRRSAFQVEPGEGLPDNRRVHTVLVAREAMATRFEILARGVDRPAIQAAAEEALDEVGRCEDRLSLFRESSDVSRINQRAAHEPVQVDPLVFGLLTRIACLSNQSGGAFDVTVEPLMRLWGFRGGGEGVPEPDELEAACNCVGMRHVELDPEHRTVRFLRPGMQLDLGAVGKGYALSLAGDVLREGGVTAALLHAGTSTVLGIGAPAGAQGWEVALPWPEQARAGLHASALEGTRATDRVLARVRLRNEALSVSAVWGGASAGNVGTPHVLDPRTGRPVSDAVMAAVVTESATDADALSTALLVGGDALQRRLAEGDPAWRSLVVLRAGTGDSGRVASCGWRGLGGGVDARVIGRA
jgi:thiamine biosynthesis lipoprotein